LHFLGKNEQKLVRIANIVCRISHGIVGRWSLFVVRCSLFVVRCSVLGARCSVLVARCSLVNGWMRKCCSLVNGWMRKCVDEWMRMSLEEAEGSEFLT